MNVEERASTFTFSVRMYFVTIVGHHLGLELLAERALEVDVLDHRHRRARRAERQRRSAGSP